MKIHGSYNIVGHIVIYILVNELFFYNIKYKFIKLFFYNIKYKFIKYNGSEKIMRGKKKLQKIL